MRLVFTIVLASNTGALCAEEESVCGTETYISRQFLK